jgi:hypothetical protein
MSKNNKIQISVCYLNSFLLIPVLFSAFREILNELQVQFIIIALSKTRQLTGIPSYTVIFRAPPRAMRVVLQLHMTVTIILCAFFRKRAPQIKVMHCHPPRTTPRFARRFAAPNDSPFYSTSFLRLGGCAPTKRDEALSSSAFHSALRASLHSSE